jgi:two-component system phosphate regulon sensor histidine kinase PhoR
VSRSLAVRGALVGALAAGLGATGGFIVAAERDSFAAWLIATALIAAGGALLGLAGLFQASRTVAAVTRAADRMSEGDLAQLVDNASDTTEALVVAFNHMATRVAELIGEAQAEHARLEALFASSSFPTIALSHDGSVKYLNAAAIDLFGADRERALGRPFIELARDYELDQIVREGLSGRGPAGGRVVTFGPRRIQLRAVAQPIRGGGDWAALLTLSDLTEVQRLDQVRRDFLTNVSHELRTPLASIKALVETMEADGSHEAQGDFLGRIHQQVERMVTLVNELLDLSRIESGAITLQPEEIDLAALALETASLVRERSKEAGVKIETPEPPGPVVEADRPSMLRVMINLLDNAIKYSPPGATVRVTFADEGELVAATVTDEGLGIAPQHLPRVFERFYKGDPSRANSGVGLGLAIVKHLVRAHGGTAEAANIPGAGAAFTIRIPKHFVGRGRG